MKEKGEPIGSLVKQIRKSNHLTQKELGERMLVSGTYISKVEKGHEVPSKKFVRLLNLEFNIAGRCNSPRIAIDAAARHEEDTKMNHCDFCTAPIYVKVKQYAQPLLAPMTRAQELRDELLALTGEMYIELPKRFCPICGNRIAPED